MVRRSASGSRVSASTVEPTRSMKTAVTILRLSDDGAPATTGVPHSGQNRAPSGTAVRQPPHRAAAFTGA